MSTRILHIAYYPSLLELREQFLEAKGFSVTSVLGNEAAMALDDRTLYSFDLVLVGFSGPQPARASMVHFLKQRCPATPVLALQFHELETFPEADTVCLSEDPAAWLGAIEKALGRA